MQKLSITDLPVQGKKVLMRVDFNVPLDAQGHITDDSRIQAALPSIRYLLQNGAAVILMSHLGRPKKEKKAEFSLRPCAKRLSELLGVDVTMAPDSIGAEVESLVNKLQSGSVLMLENLRFHPGEEAPAEHPEFVKSLAKLGDFYVNDAFGTAHRFHASTAAITNYFPGTAAAGFLLEKEIRFLGETLQNPTRPFHAIIGGAKISTKMGALQALLNKVDTLLIGGAMAYTFLKIQGFDIGDSLYEQEQLEQAHQLLEKAEKRNVPLLLPSDLLIAQSITEGVKTQLVRVEEGIPPGWQGVDIGPKTIRKFIDTIQPAKTVLWNGPVGIFEVQAFSLGTRAIAQALAKLNSAITIVAGGDSLAAIHAAGVDKEITHLSTGGGASLEYMEFGTLPGIEALSPKLNAPVP